MKQYINRWSAKVERSGLVTRATLLFGALLIAATLVAPIAYGTGGAEGFAAVTVALTVCLATGVISLLTAALFRGDRFALQRLLLGMFLRMGIPLGFCAVVHLRGGMLADVGIVYYVLVFYAVMLLVETALDVSRIKSELGTRKA